MKKNCVFIVICFLVMNFLFSSEYKTPKKLSVIQTQYFDFIYPEESTYTANLIASKADGMYVNICSLLNTNPTHHFPVVITPDTQKLNAYFTLAYSSHICVYDTLPVAGSLTVFSENITNVFYHELVHAVSCNIRSPFVNLGSKIFGDIFQPNMFLTLPLSYLEGVTVSFESKNNEGRLNDPYCMAYLTQAKLEGKFPAWNEISGARDTFTNGSLPYLFGGSFNQFLQEKYGMDKYADFWYLSGSQIMMLDELFYNIYSSSIEEIWIEFKNSVPLPFSTKRDFAYADVNGIVENEITSDYKDNLIDLKEYPDRDSFKQNGNFESLVSSEKAIAWIDYTKKKIMYIEKDYLLGIKTEKNDEFWGITQPKYYTEELFECDSYANRIQFSKDGNYMLFCSTHPNSERNYARIFDIQKRVFIGETFENLRDACFFEGKNGIEYVAGVFLDGQFASIKIYPFVLDKNEKNEELVSIGFSRNQIPFSLVNTGDDTFTYILKTNNDWSLCKLNPFTKDQIEIGNKDKDIIYRNLSSSKNNDGSYMVSFTWMQKNKSGRLPRFGKFRLSDNIYDFEMQQKDVSGGINCPILVNDDVFYIGQFFEYDRILSLPLKAVFEQSVTKESVVQANDLNMQSLEQDQMNTSSIEDSIQILSSLKITDQTSIHNVIPSYSDDKVKNYNPFKYMTRGVFFPMAMVSMRERISQNEEFSFPMELGVTYLTGDPTSTWINTLTGFYDPINKNAAGKITLENSTFPIVLTLDGVSYCNFTDGFKYDLTASLKESYSLYLSNLNNIIQFSNTTIYDYHDKLEPFFLESSFLDAGTVLYDEFSVIYSNKRKVGTGYFDYSGITLNASVGYLFQFDPSFVYNSSTLTYLGYIQYQKPNTAFKLSFFPSITSPLSFSADYVLFNYEIQKPSRLSYLFHKRMNVKIGYDAKMLLPPDNVIDYYNPLASFKDFDFENLSSDIVIKFNYAFTINTGLLATCVGNVGFDIRYNLKETEDPVSFDFTYNIEL